MKIYSMTATFGKLENETLTLQPGLNILQAPNEWGKSTWCAFLVAMLYGIETRVHTTKTALADKERYAPWSGAPMSGRIDLNWNGKDITIQRQSKGKSFLNVFRAYETESGVDVPELTAENCGQLLLGVEKEVFLRAGFLRLADLPVTQNEALRRRLNALVTTGDESATGDELAQKLKDLKNRCRLNRSTGLLPQAEAQRSELESKLRELQELESLCAQNKLRQTQLESHYAALCNHRDALEYAASRTQTEKRSAADAARDSAHRRVQELESLCSGLPAEEDIQRTLTQLRQLRENKEALQMESQLLPPEPAAPMIPAPFLGAEDAVTMAETDAAACAEARKARQWKLPVILGAVQAAISLVFLLIPHWAGIAITAFGTVAGLIILFSGLSHCRKADREATALQTKYGSLALDQWVSSARYYVDLQQEYQEKLLQHQSLRESLQQRSNQLQLQTEVLTQGTTLWETENFWLSAQKNLDQLKDARRELTRAEDYLQMLSSVQEAKPPQFPDALTYTAPETARMISDCAFQQKQLQLQLGQHQGRMSALGAEAELRQQLDSLNARIATLEETYSALEIAMSTLSAASTELQRRFAPRIAKRAQALFSQMTAGRYDRLSLGEDFTAYAGATGETTLHSALWRSEGTVDQLYLALRLAVSQELTPEAPFILDDALVRFDDIRLAQALAILEEAAQDRQVILFTCQDRETRLLGK